MYSQKDNEKTKQKKHETGTRTSRNALRVVAVFLVHVALIAAVAATASSAGGGATLNATIDTVRRYAGIPRALPVSVKSGTAGIAELKRAIAAELSRSLPTAMGGPPPPVDTHGPGAAGRRGR